ncbi:MAG: alpha/beta hydrolase [Gloeomargaritaceae cyanobacterium C42_A2020_066]|nr:alpha/beta hydrolase [Gloeomargaritaceae cyanobacterium C42_A2020_066]
MNPAGLDANLYYPQPYPHGYWTPSAYGYEVTPQDCHFTAVDGTELHAWWIPVADDQAPALLFCHGNAGNVTYRLDNLVRLQQAGISTFIFDYRGYGRSQGQPAEMGLYQDVRAAYDHLSQCLGIPAGRIVAFGRSLGGAVALHLATDPQRPLAGLVIESTFTSLSAIAEIFFPRLPSGLLAGQYDSIHRVQQINVPLLVVHGEEDELIPFSQGQALYAAAPEPKQFYAVPEGRHNDTYLVAGDDYFVRLGEFCKQVIQP